MAKKPPPADKKTERLHMLISPAEIDAIDDWRFKKRLGTRAEAVRRLCQIALALDAETDAINRTGNALTKEMERVDRAIEKVITDRDASTEQMKSRREHLLARSYPLLRKALAPFLDSVASVNMQQLSFLTEADFDAAMKEAIETRRVFSEPWEDEP